MKVWKNMKCFSKKTLIALSLGTLIPTVIADEGYNMMGYGMMSSTGTLGMSLYKGVYLALASVVFSVIFWGTYKLMIKDKKGKK